MGFDPILSSRSSWKEAGVVIVAVVKVVRVVRVVREARRWVVEGFRLRLKDC